ncbi:DUF4147 domain-containing protein [Patescibacteria group bacterium]|nr:DUF4147 domain-containing protein [Patescibacteria group bacterium]
MIKAMRVKNYTTLAKTALRKDALGILEAGLDAIETTKVVKDAVDFRDDQLFIQGKKVSLKGVKRVFVVGIGKCALEAGATIERILGDRLAGGIVLDVQGRKLHRITSLVGTHPFMSETNIDVTREIINLLKDMRKDDLVLFLVSGGGSALLCQPGNFTCQDEVTIVRCLFAAGVPIKEMNTIRKHLSYARGGWLAKYAYPARVISLIFSDVPGDDIEFIASGPTVRDTTTIADAKKLLNKYLIWKKCYLQPLSLIETPKEKKYFTKVTNQIVVSNKTALIAMKAEARRRGYRAIIKTATLAGEAKDLGPKIAKALAKERPRTVLLYGGESTVALIHKPGKGGRNQELVLAALPYLKKGHCLISFDTDGKDNTDVGGAIGDVRTVRAAESLRLDPARYLATQENNSYFFFQKAKDFIRTGNTGANVSDILIAIKE